MQGMVTSLEYREKHYYIRTYRELYIEYLGKVLLDW